MSLPSRGAPSLSARMYEFVEKFMPWRYTGIFSSPEYKSHVPVVHAWRKHAPTTPPFKPIVPSVANEGVLEIKAYKRDAKRAEILADREVTEADIAKMYQWQQATPMGGSRFRWDKKNLYIYDYDDNAYM